MDQPLPPKKKHIGCWIMGAILALGLLLVFGYFVREFVGYYRAIKQGDLNPLLGRELQSSPSRLQANQKVTGEDLKRLERADRPAMGSTAPVLTIVEFLDFGCPFCRESVPAVRKVVTEHADKVRLIMRDFPVTELHPQALRAGIAARCAYKQGQYFAYHDKLYVNQENQTDADLLRYASELSLNMETFNNCFLNPMTEQEVQEDLYDGLALGVEGTPTFFFNGVKVQGSLDETELGYLVDEFMKRISP